MRPKSVSQSVHALLVVSTITITVIIIIHYLIFSHPQIVGPKSVGASEGFLGWIAYLGAANAGIPLSIIVKEFGERVIIYE